MKTRTAATIHRYCFLVFGHLRITTIQRILVLVSVTFILLTVKHLNDKKRDLDYQRLSLLSAHHTLKESKRQFDDIHKDIHHINTGLLVPSHQVSRLKLRAGIFETMKNYLQNAKQDASFSSQLDLMRLSVLPFEPQFKNPCWWTKSKPSLSCGWSRQLLEAPMKVLDDYVSENTYPPILRCLPYFMVIGQAKSGTTDLFSKIIRHPEIAPISMKETQWLCQIRFQRSCTSIETYLNMLQESSNFIQQKYEPGALNNYITGEGTPGYLSNNDFWDMLPGNEGCKEPCVTNADIVSHLNPDSKIIVMLRNPVDRIFSLYLHKSRLSGLQVSKQHFHQLVVTYIEKFKTCLNFQTLRGCCYNYTLWDSNTEEIDLRRGVYAVYLLDWMKLFPKNQMLVLKFEDYAKDAMKPLQLVFKLLELRTLPLEELHEITQQDVRSAHDGTELELDNMWNSTRELLHAFYKPYNDLLPDILQPDSFTW